MRRLEALLEKTVNEEKGSQDILAIASDLSALARDFENQLSSTKRYLASRGQYGTSGEKALVDSFSKVVKELYPEAEVLFHRMKNYV